MCGSCPAQGRLNLPSDIPVHHITTSSQLAQCVDYMLSNHAVLGLDVEWQPSSTLPALLQVACEDAVALVDLAAVRDAPDAPASVHALLTDPRVLRLGWRFDSDLNKLASWAPALDRVEAYVEMAAAPVDTSSTGLAGCVKAVLGRALCKAEQCSDWERRPLSDGQCEYAALDAYALLLLAERIGADIPPPVPLELGAVHSVGASNGGDGRRTDGEPKPRRKESFMPRPGKGLSANPHKRDAFIQRFCVRNQVYSNCRILSASGALVAHCDRSKALWYVSRGLATRVSGNVDRLPLAAAGAAAPADDEDREDDPLTIQLNFRPEDRYEESGFERIGSLVPRQNRCVVCGVAEALSRYHIVPKCYGRHFPISHKAHQSRDILLLCVDCHEKSNRYVMATKIQVANEMNAPLRGSGRVIPTKDERTVVKAAAALLRGVDRVPEERVEELKGVVRAWWNANSPDRLADVDALSTEALEFASRLGKELPRKGGWQAAITCGDSFRAHGEIVVQTLLEDDSLDALHQFIVRWRTSFVRSLAPRFMPDDWSVDYRIVARRRKHEAVGLGERGTSTTAVSDAACVLISL